MGRTDYRALADLGIIGAGIVLAAIFINTDVVERLLHSASGIALVGSFIAGVFFTSILTAAPAMVALGEISSVQGVILTAGVGAMGAVVGDAVLFYVVRDRISERLLALTKGLTRFSDAVLSMNPTLSRWLIFILAGLIIASPLPDELGVTLLGLSKVQTTLFIPISFFFNFVGILAIGFVAAAL